MLLLGSDKMIVIIKEDQLPQAKVFFARYNSKVIYSRIYLDGESYLALSEGPVGALLLVRATLGSDELQKKFGLN